jgi:hypothetical protein
MGLERRFAYKHNAFCGIELSIECDGKVLAGTE